MLLPVLDIMAGRVVRGVAGRRHAYQPLEPISEPLAVARSFRERFGLVSLYLADLDAIGGAAPALSLYETLIADGFTLWVDAGLKQSRGAAPLVQAGVSRLIAGLETLGGPADLDALIRTWSAERIVFSLDLKAGNPLGSAEWGTSEPLAIAEQAVAAGVRSLLILDLSRVGVGEGIGTEVMCAACRRNWPEVELIAGGGIRGIDDIRRLAGLGVDHMLVASALHAGKISREEAAI